MNSRSKKLVLIGLLGTFVFISFFLTTVKGEEDLSLTYYGQTSCSICHEKYDIIHNFVTEHPEINATYLWITENVSITEYEDYLISLGEPSLPPPPPTLILNRSNEIHIVYSIDITPEILESWRLGESLQRTEVTMWIAFITGLITGVSACMLLLLSVIGTSLTIIESRTKYLVISTGLIIGLICAYLAVSVLFLVTINFLSVLNYLKYIFGGILLFIGIWQIVEYKSEESIIFGTSGRIKSVLKDFIEKRSGIYAFLVGVLFAFIKIPCFGAPYLQILFVSQGDPFMWLYIIFYFIGLLIPIIIILLALRIGFQSERVNKFRLQYRPYLRLLSGCFLITLTIYLIFDYLITLEMVLWIILVEVLIFTLLIWIKAKQLKEEQENNIQS